MILDLVKINKALSSTNSEFEYEVYITNDKQKNSCLNHQTYTNFHFWSCWINSIEKVFPRSLLFINIIIPENMAFTIPVFAVRDIYFRKILVSLPFTPFLPNLQNNQMLYLQKVTNFLVKKRFFHDFIYKINDYVKGDTNDYFLHLINLDDENKVIKSRIKPAVKKSCVRLSKIGYRVIESDLSTNLTSFYKLYRLNNKKHGSPSLPKAFFSEISLSLKDECILYFCKKGTKLLSCSLFLINESEALYAYVGTDTSLSRSHDPGHKLIISHAIQQLKSKGLKSLNLGKTSIAHDGLIQFKRSFGSEQIPLQYYSVKLGRESILKKRSLFGSTIMLINRYAPSIVYDLLSGMQIKLLSSQ
tara:strand:+ start:2801 stop:3877 length:1077 start_codon:yes stop_codon:yes gene_type:complete